MTLLDRINDPSRIREILYHNTSDLLGQYLYPDNTTEPAIMLVEPGQNPGLPLGVTATGFEIAVIFAESFQSLPLVNNGFQWVLTHRVILRSWSGSPLLPLLVRLTSHFGFRFQPGARVPATPGIGNIETCSCTLVETILTHGNNF